ncbi:hypothetical protein [Ralstonia phage RSP15]|uniref:phosphatase n=1 Tax=Ralstonia phage RSP15 TaxID=1785960 RepID=UPI00074D407D|nr:phosphatase [Ralstonia phage RSP15]BAU40112.1 hypothetical protein [Ralstonia phage RSP15]
MIIDIVKGDLLDMFDNGDFWAIAHGCNCFNTMGSGIAAQIRDRYPAAWEVDQKTPKGARSKLGLYTTAEVENGYIFNLYTQYTHWDLNDMLDYDAINKCFVLLNIYAEYMELSKPLGIPKIGAGLAMGDWERIRPLIDHATPDLDIVLVEWEPKKTMGGPDNTNQIGNFLKDFSPVKEGKKVGYVL